MRTEINNKSDTDLTMKGVATANITLTNGLRSQVITLNCGSFQAGKADEDAKQVQSGCSF